MSRQGDQRARLLHLKEVTTARGEIMSALRERFVRLAARHEEGTAPVAVSAFNLFPTPVELARRMVALLDVLPFQRVLEPSAGTGRLLSAITEACGPLAPEVTACESSRELAGELFHAFPAVLLKVGDFLTRTAQDLGGPFDRIIMNPPFSHGADARHILHALGMLADGGLLVALCYHGQAFRKYLQPLATTWDLLPPGTFRSEGTSADVVLLTFRKDRT